MSKTTAVSVEVCTSDLQSALKAYAAGADRIEFCRDLSRGGFTPTPDMLSQVKDFPIPVHILIRPEVETGAENMFSDSFSYSETVARSMIDAIRALPVDLQNLSLRRGICGVAVGALTRGGGIDLPLCRSLVREAREKGLSVTFHRAVDVCNSTLGAMDDILSLGVDRILSSGGAATALEGMGTLREMVLRCQGSGTTVLAAGGIRTSNVMDILSDSGAAEVHSSSSEVASYIKTLHKD